MVSMVDSHLIRTKNMRSEILRKRNTLVPSRMPVRKTKKKLQKDTAARTHTHLNSGRPVERWRFYKLTDYNCITNSCLL